jgi:hypothetical protein
MQTIELNKKVASIEVQGDKIIINLEQDYIPKDGEYFYVKTKDSNRKYIAIKMNSLLITAFYCYYGLDDSSMGWGDGCSFVCLDNEIKTIRPATKEERELLDKALEERGKRWNPETKQIEETPKVGDFCIFWGNAKSMARCGILSEVASDGLPYRINYGVHFKNCIPFQSAEHFKAFIKG